MPYVAETFLLEGGAGGLSFSTLWSSFTEAFNSAVTFFASQPIFLTLIAVPIGAFVVGTVVKSVR